MIKNHCSSICHRFVHTPPPLQYPSAGYYFFSAGRTHPSSPPPVHHQHRGRHDLTNGPSSLVVGTARVAGEKRVFHKRTDHMSIYYYRVRHPATRSTLDSLEFVEKLIYIYVYRCFTRAWLWIILFPSVRHVCHDFSQNL